MSEACEVIATHNFYKLSRYYEAEIHAILQTCLKDMTDLRWLGSYLPKERDNICEIPIVKKPSRKLEVSRFVTPSFSKQKASSIS